MHQTGGTHFTQGLLHSATFIIQSFSKDFIDECFYGRKMALHMCLFAEFLCFFTAVFYWDVWSLFLCKLFCVLFNQMSQLAKEYIEKSEPPSMHITYSNLIDVTCMGGLLIGLILGSYIYSCTRELATNALFASVLTVSTVLLMQYVEEDTDIKRPQTHFKQMPSICYHRLKNLKTVNYKKHWDCMLLQAAYTTTFSIYFVRFCFLLVFNYNLGTVVVGYSIAYQHMWLFATSMLVPFVKERVQNKKKLFEHSLLISGFLLPGLYYAPSYECYLFLLIPMFFCFMLVNALLDDDALGLSLKPDVFEASNTIAYLVNVIGPIFFGIVCQYFGGYGFKFFSLLPMVICVYLLNQRFMKTEQEQETEARIKQD
ncbi:uncharacterized protein LOC103314529 isoform X3 [Tribolium castaneum]